MSVLEEIGFFTDHNDELSSSDTREDTESREDGELSSSESREDDELSSSDSREDGELSSSDSMEDGELSSSESMEAGELPSVGSNLPDVCSQRLAIVDSRTISHRRVGSLNVPKDNRRHRYPYKRNQHVSHQPRNNRHGHYYGPTRKSRTYNVEKRNPNMRKDVCDNRKGETNLRYIALRSFNNQTK
jgi:hypothetical protein